MIVELVKKVVYIIICKVMYRVKYVGLDNIDSSKNYLVAANHVSWVDPIAIGCKVPKARAMGKAEMFKNPILGWIFRQLGAFPIKRGEKDFASLKHSLNILKNEKSNLIIFPEGTRNAIEKNVEAKIGAVYLAIASGVDIIPIHITKKPNIFGTITVTVGKSYSLGEYRENIKDKDMLNDKTKEMMEKIYNLAK